MPFVIHQVQKLLPHRDDVLSANHDTNNPKLLLKSGSSLIDYENGSTNKNKKKEQYFALKSLVLDRCTSSKLQQELLNEVAILKELDHANIAKAVETYEHDARLYLCLELCSGGDLYSRDPYTEERAADILGQVLRAVSYLHSKGIIHRDLKFENIMFVDDRPDAEVKIIDFGLSQKFAPDQSMSDAVGTM